MSFLENANIRLDPVDRADLPQLLKWRNSAALRSRTREWRPLTMEDQLRWFEKISGPNRRDFMFVVSVMRGKEVRVATKIGVVGLCDWDAQNRSAEVSFYLGDTKFQGKGYARLALEELMLWGFNNNLHRIWAEVYAFNEPCIRLLNRLGFDREGTMRESVFKDGKYWDAHIYGLLK